MVVLLVVIAAVIVLYAFAKARYRREVATRPPEPARPRATFEGGEAYATADEKLRIETDGPSAGGEGVLMAIVDALRARGVVTNPVEPESYGYMTVITVGGEDVVLRLGSWGREFEWTLYVESPSGKVASQLLDALSSLENIRNVAWKPF